MRKNYRRAVRLLLTLSLLWTGLSGTQAAPEWTDVTDRFITNPDFSSGSNGEWTWETSTGTSGIGSGNIRFYSGSFDFHQTLSGLPKGHYRLSVQTFYRDGGNDEAWNAHQNNSESIDAWLYAGEVSQPVVSIFSESLDYNAAGRSYTPDDKHYYPDGRDAAGICFEEGLYWNTMEFDTSGGSLTIGIRCDVSNRNANYCVADNFRLEYDGDPDVVDGWTDVTKYLLINPGFDDNSEEGWEWLFDYGTHNTRAECMEFWNATFNLWQDLTGLPKGKYRLSVQSYYRTSNNDTGYAYYINGTENLTAEMYAGSATKPIVSHYSYELPSWTDGCWSVTHDGKVHYFPNTMESAAVAFSKGAYWNTMEFETSGNIRIGLRNTNFENDNWCIFDNFRLEYYGTIVKATSVTVKATNSEILSGQQATVTATILPANALSKKVVWSSSDETIATVDQNGTVTGYNAGTATITATTIDGSKVSGTIAIKVTKTPPTAESLIINEIMASNIDEFISPAFNFDGWMELYNPTDVGVSLGGIYVSNDATQPQLWKAPTSLGLLPAHGYAVVWFGSNDIAPQNAPFKLDIDGGTIYVSDENGKLIASQAYPASMERVSYARTSDGKDSWGLAAVATPGATNSNSSFATQQLEAPVVNQPSQLFEGTLNVSVEIPAGCSLRYTTDGKLPTADYGETSTDGQFTISETTSLRLRLFCNGWLPSRVTSRSYIYKDRDYTLPVVSVVTDPDFLYSSEIGVMTTGPNGRPGNGRDDNCNWNMNWERPVNFSYLTADGAMVLNQDADLEMCGGWSRAWTPHSFKLKGTKKMGDTKYLPYQFFAQKPYIRNRTLQIRNGGNDNDARFIDPAIQYIIETSGFNIDCQSYQPSHEFINGEYIGVLNVREPNNKHFVYANYGWDDDEIDMFEMSPDSGYIQKCGTADAFNHLVDDLSPNAADADTYAEICQLLDIDEYINYMATEFYLGGTDWPQNNVKGFRHRQDGKFRFVLFDLDFAFNTSNAFQTFMDKEYYTFDQLRPASLGRLYNEHIRFVTLFKNLLQNDTFRKQFVDTYCIVGGSVLEASRVTEIANRLQEVVEGPMNMEGRGWSLSNSANKVRNGLSTRLKTAINALTDYDLMQLSDAAPLTASLGTSIHDAKLQINGIDVPTGCFNGKLFAPVVLKATAPEGYTFTGWQAEDGTIVSTKETYDISKEANLTLTAVYTESSDAARKEALAMPVKVNEISAANTMYVNDTWKHCDWIELYNTTDSDLDITGLFLSDDADEPLKFQIERTSMANTVIPAGGHLVVWADGLGGTTAAGNSQQLHTNFKLSNSDNQQVIISSSEAFVNANKGYFDNHADMSTFIDGLTYKTHNGQQSVGRYPDGGRQFYQMSRPTIERSNTLTSLDPVTGEDQNLMSLLTDAFKLELSKGWNWISHNLSTPIAPTELTALSSRIVGQDTEAFRDSRRGMVGTLSAIDAGKLYKVEMKEADTFTSDEKTLAKLPIGLLPGWNWIGYTANGAQTLTAAMQDFVAEEGDYILGQDGFATYADGKWTGSLTSLERGKGYMFYTNQAKTLTFHKPGLSVNYSRPARVRGKLASRYNIDKLAYPNVMGIIGTLVSEDTAVEPERLTLLAYCGEEIRGVGKWVDATVFLTMYGQGGEPLQYYVVDELDGKVYQAVAEDVARQSTFAPGINGTVGSPVVFRIGEAVTTDIAAVLNAQWSMVNGPLGQRTLAKEGTQESSMVYSLSGIRVNGRAASLTKGAYIVKHNDGSRHKIYIK